MALAKQARQKKPNLDHIVVSLRDLAIPCDRLVLDPKNARVHDDRNLRAITSSLNRFGQRMPIVVQKTGMIVRAGNGRLMAARAMGWEHIAAVVTDDADEIAAAFALADNRTAELAEWNDVQLGSLMSELRDSDSLLDVDDFMKSMAFSSKQVEKLIQVAAHERRETTQDDVPDPPKKATTEQGDIWTLGRHRLVCGDSTDKKQVFVATGDVSPNIMVTDPPYGVGYDPKWREEYDDFERHSTGQVLNDNQNNWGIAYSLFNGDVAYVWHAGVYACIVATGLEANSFVVRAQIVWSKQHFVFGRGAYHWKHEPCWYAVRKGSPAKWIGDRKQTTVWDIPNANPMGGKKDDSNTFHSTQKPIECMARAIRNHAGDVYDPFLGSGTTLIAAEQLDRSCYGLEIDPRYCDVIVERWENLSGGKARRASS